MSAAFVAFMVESGERDPSPFEPHPGVREERPVGVGRVLLALDDAADGVDDDGGGPTRSTSRMRAWPPALVSSGGNVGDR